LNGRKGYGCVKTVIGVIGSCVHLGLVSPSTEWALVLRGWAVRSGWAGGMGGGRRFPAAGMARRLFGLAVYIGGGSEEAVFHGRGMAWRNSTCMAVDFHGGWTFPSGRETATRAVAHHLSMIFAARNSPARDVSDLPGIRPLPPVTD